MYRVINGNRLIEISDDFKRSRIKEITDNSIYQPEYPEKIITVGLTKSNLRIFDKYYKGTIVEINIDSYNNFIEKIDLFSYLKGIYYITSTTLNYKEVFKSDFKKLDKYVDILYISDINKISTLKQVDAYVKNLNVKEKVFTVGSSNIKLIQNIINKQIIIESNILIYYDGKISINENLLKDLYRINKNLYVDSIVLANIKTLINGINQKIIYTPYKYTLLVNINESYCGIPFSNKIKTGKSCGVKDIKTIWKELFTYK